MSMNNNVNIDKKETAASAEKIDKIVICDDDKDIVRALQIYLSNRNYELLCAYTGREALDFVKKGDISLVLLDIMMPEMDGITALRAIREKSNVPVILITAKSEDADKVLGLDVGADDYITKPFNPIEVLARVRSQLRRYNKLGGSEDSNKKEVLSCGGVTLDDRTKQVTMDGEEEGKLYAVTTDDTGYGVVLESLDGGKDIKLLQADTELLDLTDDRAKGLIGKWTDNSGNEYKLKKDGKLVIKSSSGETKGTYCVAENADGTLRLNLVISGGTLEYVYTLSDDGSTVELCSPGTDTVHKWTKA